MLDNQTRRELLSKARQTGFPGSILDVFAAYEQGKDLIGEFQQQQSQQQTQQMSDTAAQQSGMQMPQQMQQPQQQEPQQPQMPVIPQGLPQGSSIPQPATPSTGLVNSNESQGTGMASNSGGTRGSQEILATGGFVEKFTEDQYNKFSSHFPFSKEQRGSIAHRATVEHPDLTMVNPKKYVFGGLKYKAGGMKTDPPSYTLPTLEITAKRNAPVPKMLEPGFQDDLAYSEAKNKLMLRQQLEGAQARFMGGENILDAIKDQDLARQAFQTMLEKYPNDKRLTSKETTRGKAAGSFLIQKAIERYLGKKLPLISNNQNYQYAIEGIKRGNNMVSPVFEIRQFQDAERDAQNQYSNYTEELQKKVDDYEKAHGTYKPGFLEKMRKTHFKFAEGGLEKDPPDWRNILNYQYSTPQQQFVAPNVRKVERPTTVAESTNRNVTHQIPSNTKELKAEKDAQAAYDALPEAMKRRDTLSANNTSSTQKAINQAYYALSNPVEAAGHAMKYGYLPQGNLGNYGHREDGDAFSDTVNNFFNPFSWGNAAYRFANDVTDKNSYTTGTGALNMGADLAEAIPFFGAAAKTMSPAVRAFAEHPLVNGIHDVIADSKLYGPVYKEALAAKAANSLTSPLGIPLYKLPGINKAYKGAAYVVGKQSPMQTRSMKQVKDALLKKTKGIYTGGDFSPTGQNALRQYIFGDAPHFEHSNIPQRGLTKYTKKYGALDNFKLKMSIPDHANMGFFDIAPAEYTNEKWAHLNPELSHLDAMPNNSPENLLDIQKALEKVIQKKGTLPISMKAPRGYTDTDIAGHNMFLTHDPATGKISSHVQDIWKFTPEEYAKKWTIVGSGKTKNLTQYKTYQQAKLMEKAGKPFVLHDVRPFEISPKFKGKPIMKAPEVFHLEDTPSSDYFDDPLPFATGGFKTLKKRK